MFYERCFNKQSLGVLRCVLVTCALHLRRVLIFFIFLLPHFCFIIFGSFCILKVCHTLRPTPPTTPHFQLSSNAPRCHLRREGTDLYVAFPAKASLHKNVWRPTACWKVAVSPPILIRVEDTKQLEDGYAAPKSSWSLKLMVFDRNLLFQGVCICLGWRKNQESHGITRVS